MKNYAFKDYDNKIMARAIALSSPVSRKIGIEICNSIRNKPIAKAKGILQGAIEKKQAIPFRRFIGDLGHKKKIGPGRYPVKASKEILKLVENVEANAQFKGLNTSRLYIRHICVNKGPTSWHYGRQSRRKMKRAHVEIVVEEKKIVVEEKKSENKK